MKFDLGDFLIFAGVIMLETGFALIDWRLALVAGGALLITAGAASIKLKRTEP